MPSNRVAPWQYSLTLSMLKTAATSAAVAEDVGICPKTAARLAPMYYLPVRARGRQKGEAGVPLPIRAAVLDLVRRGSTLKAAGATVGVTKQAVWLWAREGGVIVVKKGEGRVHRSE